MLKNAGAGTSFGRASEMVLIWGYISEINTALLSSQYAYYLPLQKLRGNDNVQSFNEIKAH